MAKRRDAPDHGWTVRVREHGRTHSVFVPSTVGEGEAVKRMLERQNPSWEIVDADHPDLNRGVNQVLSRRFRTQPEEHV